MTDTNGEATFHDLTELGDLCGCTEKQRKFAEGMLAGLSQTEAAHRAGYAGERDGAQIRSTASSVAQNKPVMALLALAESKGLGVPNAPGDHDELMRILWSHARSRDKQTSIRAVVELDRMWQQECEARRETAADPLQSLREMAEVSLDLAKLIAADKGIPWEHVCGHKDGAPPQAASPTERTAAAPTIEVSDATQPD